MTGSNIIQKRWLIITIETASRELTGKLLICAEAIKRNWNCIVTTRRSIIRNIKQLPVGVVLVKSAHGADLDYIRLLKEHGHKIVCLDEEGLVQRSLEEMVRVRSSENAIALVDRYMTWGKLQYEAYVEEYAKYKGKFGITGNTRVDIWLGRHDYLFDKKVRSIREKYGQYILIPTGFAMYNHFTGFNKGVDLVRGIIADEQNKSNDYDQEYTYMKYIEVVYNNYIDLVKSLSESFKHFSIVLKVHPSENPDPWIKLSRDFNNVHVIADGSFTEVMMGAEAIVHCGSSTAIESYMYGKPVISYCLNDCENEHEIEIPTAVSIKAKNKQEVIDLLTEIVINKVKREKIQNVALVNAYLEGWIENYTGDAASLLMDEIDKLNITPSTSAFDCIKGEEFRDRKVEIVLKYIDAVVTFFKVNKFMPSYYKLRMKELEYGARKYAGFTYEVIKQEYEMICDHRNIVTGTVHSKSNDMFIIE